MKKSLKIISVLLCLLSLLFYSLPVNAYVLSATNKGNINGVNLSGSGGTSYLNYDYTNGGVRFKLVNVNVSGPQLFLALELDSPIPAQSLVSISLSVSGADTNYSPLCFSGSYNRQVIDCSINGDNGNYTISGIFYFTQQVSSVVLWNAVPNPNLKNQPGAWLYVNDPYYSHVSKEFSETDVGIVKDLLTDIKDGTNSIDSNIETYMSQETARWTQIKQFLGDINSNVIAQGQATTDAIEAQTEQDQQDREDLSDQQSAADTSAADSGDEAEEAGTSLLSAVSSFVGLLTSASPSDCVIDMDLGNLDMGNVDLCQLSPPQPIPTIASIMLISFFVPLSWATATRMIGLFRSFTG